MKLKILYAVLLLGSISQLYGSYYWNRINFGRLYRSQCARLLCKDSFMAGPWLQCMTNYTSDSNVQIRYFQRDCSAIGGFPYITHINTHADIGVCNRPISGYFNRSVCGFNQKRIYA
jgi:hypothetical protein